MIPAVAQRDEYRCRPSDEKYCDHCDRHDCFRLHPITYVNLLGIKKVGDYFFVNEIRTELTDSMPHG